MAWSKRGDASVMDGDGWSRGLVSVAVWLGGRSDTASEATIGGICRLKDCYLCKTMIKNKVAVVYSRALNIAHVKSV